MFIGVQGITKYLLLTAFALFSVCLAAVNKVQNGDSQDDQKSTSRSIQYSWDDDRKFRNYRDNSERVVYIVISSFVLFIVLLCKCCIKYGCQDGEDQQYSNAVVHPPPRTLEPPSSNYSYNTYSDYSSTSGSALNPPRPSSRSIILPHEGGVFPSNLTAFDNPNYQPENTYSQQFYSQPSSNPTLMGDVLDMPPSYDAVVREGVKYPTTEKK